jgi:hypothetical protein
VYSHDSYDIIPNEFLEIRRPEILILEGLNLLQLNLLGGTRTPKIFASDLIDFSIYVDAEEANIRKWYMERFMLLRNTAFQNPRSFFHQISQIGEEEAKAFGIDIWERINLVNLVSNGPHSTGGLAAPGVETKAILELMYPACVESVPLSVGEGPQHRPNLPRGPRLLTSN